MKKSTIAVDLVIVLVGAAVALILLLFLTEIFAGVTQKAFHKVECQIEWLGEAYLKKSPSCEASYINIKLDKKGGEEEEGPEADSLLDVGKETSITYYLSDYKKEAIKKIKKWHSDDDYALTATHFRENYKTKYDEKDTILLEYGMDKIMAEEAKNCWDMVWKGKFPYFDRYWQLVGLKEEKKDREGWLGKFLVGINPLNYEIKQPPIFCFLCSRITFDKEVANKFKGKEEIRSLEGWMRSTQVGEYGKVVSYTEYTQDDIHWGLWEAHSERYNYEVKEPPHAVAVIYARVNQDFITHALEKVKETGKIVINIFRGKFEIKKDEIEGDLNALFVVPYAQVAEECTYMIG